MMVGTLERLGENIWLTLRSGPLCATHYKWVVVPLLYSLSTCRECLAMELQSLIPSVRTAKIGWHFQMPFHD